VHPRPHRRPHPLLSRFVAITLVLVAALGWLSWRLLEQDRALERQRTRDRLENAADLVAAGLSRHLAGIADTLGQLTTGAATREADRVAASLSEDAVLLLASATRFDAYPRGRLLHTPLPPAAADVATAVFAGGESAEFRAQDPVAAAAMYKRLATSRDRSVRAAALLRLGRAQRKSKRTDLAAETYAEMAALDEASVNGLPAPLVARAARVSLWQETGDTSALRREAMELHDALHAPRWQVRQAAFEFYDGELSRALALPPAPHGDAALSARLAIAEASASLWTSWHGDQGERLASSGARSVNVHGAHLVVIWSASGDRLAAPIVERQHVSVSLADAQNRPVLATVAVNGKGVRAARAMAESGLPWTLQVASANGDGGGIAERRRLLIAGLAVAGLLALLGTYAVSRAASRELSAARMQADFVSAVSHEFRTPLTSLTQLTELLAAGRVSSDERRAEYYDAIRRETARLHRFVESLLAFGSADAGVTERRREPFDGVRLVRETVAEFGRDNAAAGCSVELSAPDEACTLTGDQEALKRAIWNLLDNAVKYSPEDRHVEVEVSTGDGHITVAVRDRGIGVPASEQAQIFEKFQRGSDARERGIRGTGIGLAMVRQIAEAHGGSVSVHSAPGQGSTFTMRLPVRLPTNSDSAGPTRIGRKVS
jgi:two-component system phosphate regulon sensor histidine kinase PhoR